MRYLTLAVQSVLLIVLAALFLRPPARALAGGEHGNCRDSGAPYVRTTLYFGMTHSGGVVSEDEWRRFLGEQVTPRFPGGLTVWTAFGQWQRPDGAIGQEPAKVLLLVHEESPAGRAAVSAIVAGYKKLFLQESVLSETTPVCAQF